MPPNMTDYDNTANMPNTYDNVVSQDDGLVSVSYIKSIRGLLKAGQMLCCVITLICASVWETSVPLRGGGWASFVCMISLIFTIIIYILSIFRIYDKIKSSIRLWVMIEFIAYATLTLAWVITAIVAAAYGNKHASIGASAFFLFLGTGLYGVDTFFGFQDYRNRPQGNSSNNTQADNKNNDMNMQSGPGPAY